MRVITHPAEKDRTCTLGRCREVCEEMTQQRWDVPQGSSCLEQADLLLEGHLEGRISQHSLVAYSCLLLCCKLL